MTFTAVINYLLHNPRLSYTVPAMATDVWLELIAYSGHDTRLKYTQTTEGYTFTYVP